MRKFRLGTSRVSEPQARIYQIRKETREIVPDGDEVFTDLGSLAEELPGHSPRFVLLSYPLTLVTPPVLLLGSSVADGGPPPFRPPDERRSRT